MIRMTDAQFRLMMKKTQEGKTQTGQKIGKNPKQKRRKNPPQLSEKSVQKQVTSYLEALGWFIIRQNVGLAVFGDRRVKFGVTGATDLLAVHPVLHPAFFIETKRPKAKTDPERLVSQEAYRADRQRNGFHACVADDLEAFKAAYKRFYRPGVHCDY